MKAFLQKLKTQFCAGSALKCAGMSVAYWLFTLLFYELVLHCVTFGTPGISISMLGFSLAFACLPALVLSFLPAKARFWADLAVSVLCMVLYGSQMVYYFIFGSFYSVAQMQLGGAALTSFWKETLLTMYEHLPEILLLALPIVIRILLHRFLPGKDARTNALWRYALAALAVLAHVASVGLVSAGGTGYFSNHYFYHSKTTTTLQATERFGLLTAFRLDLQAGTPAAQTDVEENTYFVPDPTTPTDKAPRPADPEQTLPPEQETRYNVIQIDFDALNAMTERKKILALNNYCAGLTGTNQNAYTGMLRDYNLIVLCAESFATGAIHKELTPTLYRLANEGIIFHNYYNTFPNNTTDGEYALCMGLYPDGERGKETSSFYSSRNSFLPFCLGNLFRQQRGIRSYGYHNYLGNYYGREESHPNLGYDMKFAGDGMWFTTPWPASDLEMMEQSVDDYITADRQFHAYYMTFSGHFKYDVDVNPMAERNWNLVEDLDYSDPALCYLSCNIELEKALAYLMERLEAEGVAEKTAIVLAGDHFPYGLTEAQYSELVGYEIDEFTKQKSTLIFWVGGLEENIIVDEYCCNVDILPTILNLWGFTYDSRMLAGTDVFSDAEHMAVLSDMSFFTDKVWMNASTGQVRYLVDESQLPEGYIDNTIRKIQTKFSVSADILNQAYYNFIFEQGQVTIPDNEWREQEEETKPVQPEEPVPSEPVQSDMPEATSPVKPPQTDSTDPSQPKPDSTEPSQPEEKPTAPSQPDAPSEPMESQPPVSPSEPEESNTATQASVP